jgi:FkbM family methyltransferase
MKFDFIEIGTSNFETLIEICDNSSIGISIEPIKEYLDMLPNKENVIKLQCGISDINSTVDLYHVELSDINKYGLPDWVRGCNSIINPHPSTKYILKELNLEHLMKKVTCEVITWDTLVKKFNIECVDFLKIDTEGHDCYIIKNIINSNSQVLPKTIQFENNILTNSELFKSTLEILNKNGYRVLDESRENVFAEKI